ncbi:hypothetical protein K505DRAFT_78641 [Melanomma pulvis-pyrius CBS 109.77]|uniref:Uncharacterized protein n=1 Tax=Melanomma pulvis-pyrius CBS 109.77 TaxID=1314802 RepID=A0A6A6X2F9_9PLEO|nr:hypothetical protein K505DRAFT_78641 [Melanomma pulvis-pyrius CBS 109.77]
MHVGAKLGVEAMHVGAGETSCGLRVKVPASWKGDGQLHGGAMVAAALVMALISETGYAVSAVALGCIGFTMHARSQSLLPSMRSIAFHALYPTISTLCNECNTRKWSKRPRLCIASGRFATLHAEDWITDALMSISEPRRGTGDGGEGV